MSNHVPHRAIRLRVALQIAAALAVSACVIGWSLDHYRRHDFSRSHKFGLSNQTKQTLSLLGSPARVIVYFSPSSTATGSELHGDIMALLREYQFLSQGQGLSKGPSRSNLTVERVDPLRNPARARDHLLRSSMIAGLRKAAAVA